MFRKILGSLLLCLPLVLIAAANTEQAVQEPAQQGSVLTDPVQKDPAPMELLAEEPLLCSTPNQPPAQLLEAPQAVLASSCTVTVDCWDGSQRTCTGSPCFGYDSDCPSQRGYCYGSTTGFRYCPQCCSSTTPCSKYEGRSCSPNGSRIDCLFEGSGCASCFCSGGIWNCP